MLHTRGGADPGRDATNKGNNPPHRNLPRQNNSRNQTNQGNNSPIKVTIYKPVGPNRGAGRNLLLV